MTDAKSLKTWLGRLAPETLAAVANDKNALAVMAAHVAPPPPRPATPPAGAPCGLSRAEVARVAERLLGSPDATSTADKLAFREITVDVGTGRYHDLYAHHSGDMVELVGRLKSMPPEDARQWLASQGARKALPWS
jgi:hypothetical protein